MESKYRFIPQAILLDRDGTLVKDVPYNKDPKKVKPMLGATEALDQIRKHKIPTAVVSNQSGIARGILTWQELKAVNHQVEKLLGPLGPWFICPHGEQDNCQCRKPKPGLLLQAANVLGVEPQQMALIGDIGSDVQAASAVGARGVLVPTPATLPDEISQAKETAPDLISAVNLLLQTN